MDETYLSPGQLIQGMLDAKGWTQKVLAIVMGVDRAIISKMVSDKRPVDAETALLFSEVFDIPAETILEVQKRYDLAKARLVSRPDPKRTNRAHIYGGLPIAEMVKRGWLAVEDVNNIPEVEAALTKFFCVESLEEIEILPHAAKKTYTSTAATPAQLAWIYRVREIASEMLVGRYSESSVRAAIGHLNKLLNSAEEARKVPRILAECGIRFVIVESLVAAKIDGVCFWLNEMSPVIGMSLRHDRIDNFWFVLRHECEHVLRRHGQSTIMLDTELEGERAGTGAAIAEEERVANEAAANFCVSRQSMDSFIARKAPFFNERDILGLARTLQVHPGLVAGQLQHRTGRYDRFRQHLVKIRSIVAPSAIVDGWGDVAPVGI
jgi:HTH-type transcriptional regulator/antitoxin HigA